MSVRTIDDIILHLLACGTQKHVALNLTETEINDLCLNAAKIFMAQPMLLEIDLPIIICGDLHGYYHTLMRIFKCKGFPPSFNYLFLGDYVDRGKMCLETICLLLAYKVKYPLKFYMLRGNHECSNVSYVNGFFKECFKRYNPNIWKIFINCFECMPVAAVVQRKIFCCHGGLSPGLRSMNQIRKIQRPVKIPCKGLLCDLLWSDPNDRVTGWQPNPRGVSYTFGADVVKDFLNEQGFSLVCRAHTAVKAGFEFFSGCNLVTIFSVPDYLKKKNDGAILFIDYGLKCTFEILERK